MPQYLSPGVYVEEVPSAIKPIAGVSTSTAAFIGVIPDSLSVPPSFPVVDEKVIADGTGRLKLKSYPVATEKGTFNVRIPDSSIAASSIENSHDEKKSYVRLALAPESSDQIVATYNYWVEKKIENPQLTGATDKKLDIDALFPASEAKPARDDESSYKILRSSKDGQRSAITGATLSKTGKLVIQFTGDPTLGDADVILSYRLQAQNENIGESKKDGKTVTFDLANKGAVNEGATVMVNDKPAIRQGTSAQGRAEFEITGDQSGSRITVRKYPEKYTEVFVDYLVGGPVKGQTISAPFDLCNQPVLTEAPSFQVWVGSKPVANVLIEQKTATTPARIKFLGTAPETSVKADYVIFASFKPADIGKPVLCTSFSEYKRNFGDFSIDPMHSRLTHAVYGFFNNGGTRCYVVRARDATPASIEATFDALDRIEDISIVAAPGIEDDGVRGVIDSRCKNKGDRFAIFDGPEKETDLNRLIKIKDAGGVMPNRTDAAAWYFPWIKVFDPVAKMLNPAGDGAINVPPSGHIAGVYARVDAGRGVHKAPANEPILGALGVAQALSKAEQDGLNPKGVNCIRVINDNIMVWGARTIGGDGNTDLKYINVKRMLLFLKKSIYEGTQWVVFEPNSPALWQTITRNVTGFLTAVWRSGALFGNTPQEAFYVKCDAETNTTEARENGQVITEVGVAIVRPAEFVIFRISQWPGPGQ
jgi:uncharacterized protein